MYLFLFTYNLRMGCLETEFININKFLLAFFVKNICYQMNVEDSFTGLGFFTVNRSVLTGLAATIFTYTVILLQLDNSTVVNNLLTACCPCPGEKGLP